MLASCENCVRSVPLTMMDPEADPEARVGCRGPDHTWCGEWQVDTTIVPAPTNVDVPHAYQEGDIVTCTMGNWTGEPHTYYYYWTLDDGMEVSDDADCLVTADIVGRTITCVVTAANVSGMTEAPPSNEVVVAAPV